MMDLTEAKIRAFADAWTSSSTAPWSISAITRHRGEGRSHPALALPRVEIHARARGAGKADDRLMLVRLLLGLPPHEGWPAHRAVGGYNARPLVP